VGLGVAGDDARRELVLTALRHAECLGEVDGVAVWRWQDPSGVRLVIALRDDEILDLLPSYAGTPGAVLADLWSANPDVVVASIVDADGDRVTALAAELEQRWLLPGMPEPVGGAACVVALGVAVEEYPDDDAFSASDASLLSGGRGDDRPAHFAALGWAWPPRMAAESFLSYGVSGDPVQATAYARLNGTVLGARRRTVAATGRQFVTARVRTAGFEVDVCLPGDAVAALPRPGSILAGTVFLVASLPSLVLPAPAPHAQPVR